MSSKIALITGAGTGIGRAVTAALAASGYSVVLTGRRQKILEQTQTKLNLSANRSLVFPADVTSADDVHRLFEATVERFGRLDVLFNNAGSNVSPTRIDEMEVTDWQAIVDVNLTGVFLCTREAFRIMKSQNPQGGRIINNGSISATTPRPRSVAYTATKHGVTGITKSTSLDGREFQIACGQIDIGNAETELAKRPLTGALQASGQTTPEPMMDVDHAASAVAYMASLPLDTNVLFMTVMANHMPFVGRG